MFSIICHQESKRLCLFFMVGALNTLFGYSLYAVLLFLQFHYALASLISTIGGIFFNFKTTGIIVFKNHNNGLIFKFVAVYTVCYLLNITGLKIFSLYGFNLYLAGAILTLPIALLGYGLQKKFVFGEVNHESYKYSDRML